MIIGKRVDDIDNYHDDDGGNDNDGDDCVQIICALFVMVHPPWERFKHH